MEKINQYLVKFTKYYSPIIATAVALDLMGYNSTTGGNTFLSYLFDIAGWIGLLWCVVLVYLFFAIALNEKLKNAIVRKLAGIKENDEREVFLTGVASKKTFITVTGVLILFLFLNAVQLSVFRFTDKDKTAEKNGAISIGLGFPIITRTDVKRTEIAEGKEFIVNYNGLPLTSGATTLLIAALQVAAFYYYSRNEIRKNFE